MGWFEKLLNWKTPLEPVEEPKTEQEDLEPDYEPDTSLIDIHKTVTSVSLYDETFSDLNELIDTYRNLASNYEIGEGIDEIENECVIVEDDESITINTDRLENKNLKKKIEEAFDEVLKITAWNDNGYRYFRQWFIDGRLYAQKVVYSTKKKGIHKVNVFENPKKLKRYKDKKTKEVFFKFEGEDRKSYIVPKDGIVFVPSGIKNQEGTYWISELHKVIRPFNNYRLMMDSALIYFITRAPQRRAFYIDIGNSPTKKGEQEVKKMMARLSQRISYDSTTGKVNQKNNSYPINEDYFLPTRGDTRGTRIDTLQGDTNLLDPEMISMYKKPVYKSMGIPFARIDEDAGATIDFSNSGEMTRQELKFAKKRDKLRKRFQLFFDDLLKTQLILKGDIQPTEWPEIKSDIYYIWKNDSYVSMVKQQEILAKQIELANELQPFIGKYFSEEYRRKKIFKQTEEDIEQQDKIIDSEKNNKQYQSDIEPE